MKLEFLDWGNIDYRESWTRQQNFWKEVAAGSSSKIIFCEHPAVITCGRKTDSAHLFASQEELQHRSITVVSVDRGGDITLHAPGQLVVYTIMNLDLAQRDLHGYLRKLEEVVIDLLSRFDIVASRFPSQTGVWVGEKKIASIGIGVKRWVTFHGIGLNVNTDLKLFNLIKPCGLDTRMTSMKACLGREVFLDDVKTVFSDIFRVIFNRGQY